jgi:hypothetical protein
MIISHKHRFIFLHCRKVAGSTISVLLNHVLGPKDIQIGVWDDVLKSGGRLNATARKTILKSPIKLITKSVSHSVRQKVLEIDPMAVNQIIKNNTHAFHGGKGAHVSAQDIKNAFPDEWSQYHKFCFVRNPWDHAVSDYYWRTRKHKDKPVPFKEFLKRLEDPDRPDPQNLVPLYRSNWPIYTIDNRIAVDFVGRYEQLDDDLQQVGRHVGLDLRLTKDSGSKRAHRDRSVDFRDLYDDECAALVRNIYSNEIEAFGYEPPFK